MTHIQGKKQATETTCKSNQMLDLTEKDFQIDIMNMFTEKKSLYENDMMTMLNQIENTNKDIGIIKKLIEVMISERG